SAPTNLGDLELQALASLAFVADLFQRTVNGRAGVDIAQKQLRLEGRGPSQKAAMRVEDHAVAVEDELVLAADGVDPGDIRAVVRRPSADHRLARRALAVVLWRAV